MRDEVLRRTLDAELRLTPPPAVATLAAQLAARAGSAAVAVLYYGSTLRDDTLDGILDFYILLDRVSAWPGSRFAAMANRVLPPNVGYYEDTIDGHPLRAKVARMSLAQFRKAMSPRSLDTTLWARFSQPCACIWSRSDVDRSAVTDAVQAAVVTAAHWAAVLGPVQGEPGDYWRALFAQTYHAELRVEKLARGADIVTRAAARYAALLPAAWRADNIRYEQDGAGLLTPQLSTSARHEALRRWDRRRRLGKPLNILRLLKAALTFDGGADYIAWKVERHSGFKLELAPWQRRFPLLAAPGIYLQLRRHGVLR